MKFFRIIRFGLTLLVFAVYCLLAALHLYAIIVWSALAGTLRQVHRKRVGRWRSGWTRRAYPVVVHGLGLNVQFNLDLPNDRNRPLIIVSNHRTLLDIFFLSALAEKIRRNDLRWVLKEPLRRGGLFIGRSCVETECAFVSRDGQRSDLTEVERCARIARSDKASMAIFPEGTRFRGTVEGSGYKTLLKPHTIGFALLRRELPRHDILSVTLDWHGGAEKATTLFQNAASIGAGLVIHAKLHELKDDAAAWLTTEWGLKDEMLVSRSAQNAGASRDRMAAC